MAAAIDRASLAGFQVGDEGAVDLQLGRRQRRSMARLECPVPKSSIDTCTPLAQPLEGVAA
jgi:hypothetical protein